MSKKDETEVQKTDVPEEGQTPTSDAQDAAENFDREYVTKLRSEAAKYRQQLKEAKDKLTALEQAEMSEKEKLQARLDAEAKARETAETAMRQERARLAVTRAALKAGIDPELAEKLVEVEYDDAGQPVAVEKALAGLVKKYPHLVAGDNGSPTNPSRERGSTLTKEDVKKMTAAEINARWDEVQKVISS
jgi:DNA repair exonuclease SbcCD ATPase subunit